jgi:hypothetical protein
MWVLGLYRFYPGRYGPVAQPVFCLLGLLRLRERPLRSRACFSQSLAIVGCQLAEHQASNNHGEFD